MKWKRLTYSICGALVVTAIAYAMENQGRELLILPGLLIQFTFNWLMLLIPTGDHYFALPTKADVILNFAFYASIVFIVLSLITLIRDNHKN